MSLNVIETAASLDDRLLPRFLLVCRL